ncbi:MAG: hypothetical protein HQL55_07575 [Magnetococcales bacterium]|nr:hypothetical protein [Magnetococcales bacterium]
MTNLITNSVAGIGEQKIDDEQKGKLELISCLSENCQWVVIQVADNGPGIPVEDRDRVFEPYFTTKKKGTGLGLAIVKKIIEDHGGSIRIRDSSWGGAMVEILLPVCCSQDSIQSNDGNGAEVA